MVDLKTAKIRVPVVLNEVLIISKIQRSTMFQFGESDGKSGIFCCTLYLILFVHASSFSGSVRQEGIDFGKNIGKAAMQNLSRPQNIRSNQNQSSRAMQKHHFLPYFFMGNGGSERSTKNLAPFWGHPPTHTGLSCTPQLDQ